MPPHHAFMLFSGHSAVAVPIIKSSQAPLDIAHSYLFYLLVDAPDAETGVRWGRLASVLSFAIVRAISSSDYVAVR